MLSHEATRILLAALVIGIHSRKLPPGIVPCLTTEPDFEACALRHGREAIPHVVHGIPSYHMPSLDPLKIERMSITEPTAGSRQISLAVELRDVEYRGLKNAHLESIKIDLEKDFMEFMMKVPECIMIGTYNMTGRVLLLPLKGHGQMNATLKDLSIKLNVQLARYKRGKAQLEYYMPVDSKMTFNTTRVYLDFENLFDGDPTISRQLNVFMDENWRDLVEELGPPITEGINLNLRHILANMARQVPINEIFPNSVA